MKAGKNWKSISKSTGKVNWTPIALFVTGTVLWTNILEIPTIGEVTSDILYVCGDHLYIHTKDNSSLIEVSLDEKKLFIQ